MEESVSPNASEMVQRKFITICQALPNRNYVSLGDITVTVNKTTIFLRWSYEGASQRKAKEKSCCLGRWCSHFLFATEKAVSVR